MPALISPTTHVVAARDQVSCDLAAEAVILNLKDGIYYGLDPVGADIWKLLQQQRTVRELRDMLVQEYDVEPDHCEQDLIALLRQMAESELIDVVEAKNP